MSTEPTTLRVIDDPPGIRTARTLPAALVCRRRRTSPSNAIGCCGTRGSLPA